MDRQSLAIAILEQARDILSQRLVDRVLEARDEILEDARGDSFLGEIESLHEQIGGRLVHLTQILSSLPPHSYEVASPAFDDEPTLGENEDWIPAPPAAMEVDLAFASGGAGTASEFVGVSWAASHLGRSAEPRSPDARNPDANPRASLVGWQMLLNRVSAEDWEAVGRSLSTVLELSTERAALCAENLVDRLAGDGATAARLASIKPFVEAGDRRATHETLRECFGLTEGEATRAVEALIGRRPH